MELKETVALMNSADYKDRFKAEYYQLEERISKLAGMLSRWDAGELGFVPSCPYDLLEAQLNTMKTYAYLLLERANIEGIEL